MQLAACKPYPGLELHPCHPAIIKCQYLHRRVGGFAQTSRHAEVSAPPYFHGEADDTVIKQIIQRNHRVGDGLRPGMRYQLDG